MKDREIIEFESRVKSALEWSGLDAKNQIYAVAADDRSLHLD